MSIFNPWGELRALKARLAAEEEAYRIEEAQQQAEWAKKTAMMQELERANATLRRENEELRRERQTLHARILNLLTKLDKAVDARDPKTGRFVKKAK